MQNLHDVMRISIGVTGGFSRRRGVLAGALAGVATVCWPGGKDTEGATGLSDFLDGLTKDEKPRAINLRKVGSAWLGSRESKRSGPGARGSGE